MHRNKTNAITNGKNNTKQQRTTLIALNGSNSRKTRFPELELLKRKTKIIEMARESGLNIRGLIIHDNLDMLASVDSKKNLRLQEIFLKADNQVLRALFRTCARRSRNGDEEKVNKFLLTHPPGKRMRTIPRSLLKNCFGPRGEYYNLQTMLERVMRKYTGNIPNIYITWREKSIGSNSITWGTSREIGHGGLIKINKILDSPRVPRYVVESIVYHELLHLKVPSEAHGDELASHTERFHRLLSKFPYIEEAEEWKKNYLFKYPHKSKKRSIRK